jgi:hypothetical protein
MTRASTTSRVAARRRRTGAGAGASGVGRVSIGGRPDVVRRVALDLGARGPFAGCNGCRSMQYLCAVYRHVGAK